ncbi:LOW QUALITY PROTEIN: hypothetical protein QYF61_025644 [Mycteria americana]|uniref:Uncharacterized protein n=1 Tax=Mycteria americana TaxID=33587 RepID=A0AAN7S1U1_MYCAM|nr:LOW QUALITY PROTEIN: hypothetical protein QYF61_025644 [Mycteria americana]
MAETTSRSEEEEEEKMLQVLEQIFPAACGGPTPVKIFLTGTAACGEPTLEQRKNIRVCESEKYSKVHRIVISGRKSSWKQVTSGVPSGVHQGLVVGPILSNTFINDLDDGAECTLSKNGAAMNLMKFDKGKCQVLPLGNNNLRHQYTLAAGQLESSSAEKDVRVLVDSKLTVNEKCIITTKNANSILSCIRQTIARRLGEVILALYSSLTRLDCWVQFWMIKGVEHLSCHLKRLKELGLFGLKKRTETVLWFCELPAMSSKSFLSGNQEVYLNWSLSVVNWLDTDTIKRNFVGKSLGVLVDKLDMSRHGSLAAMKANCIVQRTHDIEGATESGRDNGINNMPLCLKDITRWKNSLLDSSWHDGSDAEPFKGVWSAVWRTPTALYPKQQLALRKNCDHELECLRAGVPVSGSSCFSLLKDRGAMTAKQGIHSLLPMGRQVFSHLQESRAPSHLYMLSMRPYGAHEA